MIIRKNDINKEVKVLKHFKINNDEYVLYKDIDKIAIGLIDQNSLVIPNNEKFEILKKVLGKIINNSVISSEYNCTILDNNINMSFQEIGVQYIKLTDNQLNNLLGKHITNNNVSMNNKNKQNSKLVPILIVILLVLTVAVTLLLFKDKIFNNNSSGKEPTSKEKTTNKEENNKTKYKKDATAEELLERGNQATYNADVDAYLSLVPDFQKAELKKYITKEELINQYNKLKQEYGEDAKVTYNITNKTKKDDSWIEDNNKYLQEEYKTNIKMIECYELEGTMTKSGSLKTDVDDNPFYETWYCKFSDGTTGFIFG